MNDVLKPSDIDWLDHIPDEWNILRCKYLYKEVDERSKTGGEVRLTMSQKRGLIPTTSFEEKRLLSETNVGGKICRKNDLVLNRLKAHLGVFALAQQQGVISPDYSVFRPIHPINPRFFELLLKSQIIRSELQKKVKGIVEGFWRLYSDDFYNIRLPVPPIDEQDKIVKFLNVNLSKIQRFISKKRRLITVLKEKKQAIINQAVTKGLDPNAKMKPSGIDWLGDIPENWGLAKLKNLAKFKSGDSITSLSINNEGDFPVYGGNGLRGYTTSFTHDGNYALIGRQGALCGNIHFVSGRFWASEHAVVVTIKQGNDLMWLCELMRAMNLNQYSESAAQPGISVEKIQNLRIPLPSTDEQKDISEYILSKTFHIDNAISKTQREIDLITEYRTRLISDVVTGKIDLRNIELEEILPNADFELKNDETKDLVDTTDEVIDDNASN